MKVQYFGDVNDYRKYILLRRIASELKIGVCWMLTPDDGRPDGANRGYLTDPAQWRSLDPDLFDFLTNVKEPPTEGCFNSLSEAGMISGATFFADEVPKGREERARYHAECRRTFADREMVFFDPDNGFEVTSHPRGRAKARKYIFYDELRAHYDDGKSVLVYQHFPFVPRNAFIATTIERIALELPGCEVAVFRTPHVVFFAAIRPEHRKVLSRVQESLRDVSAEVQVSSSYPEGHIKLVDRLFSAAHRVCVMLQRYSRIFMPRELGDKSDLDALRLKDRDEGVSGAVRSDGGEAKALERRSPDAGPEIIVNERSTSTQPG